MNDLEAIARDLHLSAETLKRPADLLSQGYHPSYLATYRPDELGQLDVKTLAKLKRLLAYRKKIAEHRESLQQQGAAEGWWTDSIGKLVEEANSIAHIDGMTRNVRSKKSSRSLAAREPIAAELAHSILTASGESITDLESWIKSQEGISHELAENLVPTIKQYLGLLLSEDVSLLNRLGQTIHRRSLVTIKILPEPTGNEQAKTETTQSAEPPLLSLYIEPTIDTDTIAPAAIERTVEPSANADEYVTHRIAKLSDIGDEEKSVSNQSDYIDEPTLTQPLQNSMPSAQIALAELGSGADEIDEVDRIEQNYGNDDIESSGSVVSEKEPTATIDPTTALAASMTVAKENDPVSDAISTEPIIEGFQSPNSKRQALRNRSGASESKKIITKSLKPLTPRQKRRKWLRSVLQRYSKLRKPLARLGHYEALILGRGQRSQIIAMNFEYDRESLVRIAREAFGHSKHPFDALLSEIARESLFKTVLPRLEHDVFSELEEAAHLELTELAVRHLQELIDQRPIRGHRILLIDAMGPKSAAVAIVDPQGKIDFTGELPAVSGRADIVSQNVATLGSWIHKYKVTLAAISNGNSRKFLMNTVAELMKQSGGSTGLRWTIVDRTGADAYCDTRQALQELPSVGKRHRAAVWLAWRLQDPLIEITKIDPARLRLGSYQRELPQEELETALQEAVSSSVAARGIDVWNSHEKSLVCLPGITTSLAREIVALRDRHELSTREQLLEALRANASSNGANESQLRQASGYLRLFASSQSLDATMIHPEDYRLAERLVATGELKLPPASPEDWQMPSPVQATAESQKPSEGSSDTANPENEPGVTEESEASPSSAAEAASQKGDVESEIESVEPKEVDPVVADSDLKPDSSASLEQAAATDAVRNELKSNDEANTNSLTDEKTNVESSPEPAPGQPIVSLEASIPNIALANPENPVGPLAVPPLSIDVEKLARGWQVGREKTKVVARALQQPFADTRDARYPIPLLEKVPTIDDLVVGQSCWGIITGVVDFGAFVDLGPDCNGLIHVSTLSRDFVDDPHEAVQTGDLIQVWVLSVEPEKRRVSLSALPPGEQPMRRGNQGYQNSESNQQSRDRGDFQPGRDNSSSGQGKGRSDQRTGQNSGQPSTSTQARPQRSSQGNSSGGSQARNAPRKDSAAGNTGSNNSSGGGSQSKDRNGNYRDRKFNNRGDRNQSREDLREFNRKQEQAAKNATPISDEMLEGREPLRSFSDLLQFMQPKRSAPTTSVKPVVIADQNLMQDDNVSNSSEEASKLSIPEQVGSDIPVVDNLVTHAPKNEQLMSDDDTTAPVASKLNQE